MEVPGFNETKIKRLGSTQYKKKRIVFDREEALSKAPPYIAPILEDLFDQIDRTELIINFYDLSKGRRTTEPRAELLKKFTEEQLAELQAAANKLNMRTYLQLRHRLVELRTEQYTYSDSIKTTLLPHVDTDYQETDEFRFDEDIFILPMGLNDGSPLSQKIFADSPDPFSFTESELKQISDFIWTEPPSNKLVLDFRNPEQVLPFYKMYYELINDGLDDPELIYKSSTALIETLHYYEQTARLTDIQRAILFMKIQNHSNMVIAENINKTYGTTYNPNYISTIYRQKILPAIAKAADYHRQTMENIFYPELFKKCKDCGKYYLKTTDFYMRQTKSKDGFAIRCKMCQKIKREQKNGNKS